MVLRMEQSRLGYCGRNICVKNRHARCWASGLEQLPHAKKNFRSALDGLNDVAYYPNCLRFFFPLFEVWDFLAIGRKTGSLSLVFFPSRVQKKFKWADAKRFSPFFLPVPRSLWFCSWLYYCLKSDHSAQRNNNQDCGSPQSWWHAWIRTGSGHAASRHRHHHLRCLPDWPRRRPLAPRRCVAGSGWPTPRWARSPA